MAANDDQARLLVSIEATQAKFEKQLAAIAKRAGDTAGGIERNFKRANDNAASSFSSSGAKITQSLGAQRAAAQQLSFQLNDIATQLGSGTSPFRVLAQQGGQVVQALNQAGGATGAIRALGGAFGQILNPIGLVTIAIGTVAAAAYEYFSSVEEDGAAANKALEEHRGKIRAALDAWGSGAPQALIDYNAELEKLIANNAKLDAIKIALENATAPLKEAFSDIEFGVADVQQSLIDLGKLDAVSSIQSDFDALAKAIQNNEDTTDEAAKLLDTLRKSADSAGGVLANNLVKALEAYGAAAERARPKVDALNEAAGRLNNSALAAMADPRTWRGTGLTDQSADGPIQGGGFMLPESGPSPERRPLIELEGLGESARSVKDSFDGLDGTVKRYVDNVVKAESGGNASAKNPNSSATGVGQFIESTWLNLFKKHFPDRAQSMADSTILALRSDAEISRTLIEAYARENAGILRQAGVSVNEAALQLAHFLGPGGAVSVLTAKSGTPVSQVLGSDAIAANPSILGGGATVDDVIAYAQRRTQAVQGETAAVTQLNDAWAGLRAPTDAHTQAVNQQSQAYQDFGQIAQTAFQGLANALADGKLEGKELLQIVMQIVQQLFSMPSAGGGGGLFGGGGFGGILSGIFGSIFHKGGVAGGPAPQRMVSPSTFAGAKRYHTGGVAGLMPGEVPAILQRGEVVLPRGTKTGGAQQVHVTVGVSADNNGNLLPFVESVSQKTVSSAAPKIVSAANQQVVPTMAAHQKNKAGAEWR